MVKHAEADLHKVGRSGLQEARNATIDTSQGNCQLAAGGRLAHFSSQRTEVLTAPIIELGRAIIALMSGNLPRPPKGETWFYGTPTGRSTIGMRGGEWDDL